MGKKREGICKFCGEYTKLCDAHIIPKNFYMDYKKTKYRRLCLDDFSWEQVQSGLIDKEILCSDCDNKLGVYDDEGDRVLLKKIADFKKQNAKYTEYIFNQGDFNYDKLRKFFISMLWRASISKQINNVSLGPYENKALNILKNINNHDNLFKIFIFKSPDGKILNQANFINQVFLANDIIYELHFSGFQINIAPRLRNNSKEYQTIEKVFFTNERLHIMESQSFYEDKVDIIRQLSNKNIPVD